MNGGFTYINFNLYRFTHYIHPYKKRFLTCQSRIRCMQNGMKKTQHKSGF